MKKILFSAVVLLLFTFFNSCKKNDYPPFFNENCRVISLDISDESGQVLKKYNYDKNGFISSASTKVISTSGSNVGLESTDKFDYTRDKNGHIINVQYQIIDPWGNIFEDPIEVIYDSKGEKIIKLVESSDNQLFREYNLKYNWKGLVSEYTLNYLSPDLSVYNEKRFFEYNAMGQLIRKTVTDNAGDTTVYYLYEPKGKTVSNEAYLLEHGLLPIDLTTGDILPIVDGGVGSVEKVYPLFPDNMDLRMDSKSNSHEISSFSRRARRIDKSWSMSATKPNTSDISLRQPGMHFVLYATITLKSVVLNQRGYPQSRAFQSVDMYGYTSKSTQLYQFDCSGRGRK